VQCNADSCKSQFCNVDSYVKHINTHHQFQFEVDDSCRDSDTADVSKRVDVLYRRPLWHCVCCCLFDWSSFVCEVLENLVKCDYVFIYYFCGLTHGEISHTLNQGRMQVGGGGSPCPPPSLACAIFFCAWLLPFRHITQLTLSTELVKVWELYYLSLILTLVQPRCKFKCNLTLTVDSRYNQQAFAWEYQRRHLKHHASCSLHHLQQLSKVHLLRLLPVKTTPIRLHGVQIMSMKVLTMRNKWGVGE